MVNICRTCLSFNDLRKISTIHDIHGKSLFDILSEHYSVHIPNPEKSSSVLCHRCLTCVHLQYSFSKCAKLAEEFFRTQISVEKLEESVMKFKKDRNLSRQDFEPWGQFETIKQENDWFDLFRFDVDEDVTEKKVQVDSFTNIHRDYNDGDIVVKDSKDSIDFPVEENVNILNDEHKQAEDFALEDFKKIVRNHKKRSNFYCLQCTERFVTKKRLKVHVLSEHPAEKSNLKIRKVKKRKLICSQCPLRKFNTERNYEIHMRKHANPNNNYECEICHKEFTLMKMLKKHQELIQVPQSPHTCSNCEKSYTSDCRLKLHSCTDPTMIQCYPCETCGRNFRYRSNLRKHVRSSHEMRSYKCKFCDFEAAVKDELRKHAFIHSDDQAKSRKVKNHDYTKKRNRTSNAMNETKFKCDVCNKTYANYGSFGKHQAEIHSKNYRYICPVCGKTFHMDSHFRGHMRIHTNERPYECKQCSKKFRTQISWRMHTRLHENDRKYSCQFCPKTFLQGGHLAYHLRVHENLRPFKCDYCKKAFRTSSILKVHTRIHTGEMPYKCNVCEKMFYDASMMTKHKKAKHGIYLVDRGHARFYDGEAKEVILA